jgi:hypothetical protein
MTTTFPGAVDALPRPAGNTKRDAGGGLALHTVIDSLSDAIEAMEPKVGISESSAQDSPLANTVLASSTNGKSKWRQVATGDVATNAITQASFVTGTTGTPTTTSASFVDLTDMSITITTIAGSAVKIFFAGTFKNSTVANVDIGFSVDGGGEQGIQTFTEQTADYFVPIGMVLRLTGLSAGSHTFKVRWKTGGGTASNVGTQRYFLVEEVKK